MKKYLLILIFGLLIDIPTFAINEVDLSNTKQDSSIDSSNRTIVRTIGKKLVKGTWLLGGTFSSKSNKYSDVDLLVADIERFNQRAFNVRLEGSYFFKENLSAGLGLQFGEDKLDLKASLLNNMYKRSINSFNRSYGAVGFIKNHIPISSNNVFFITNQTELFYGFNSGPSETYVGDVLERKYSTQHCMGLTIRPGILIFFTNNFAFDLNMGILGFLHSVEDVSYEYPPNNMPPESSIKNDSKNRSTNINFKFDLLKVGFGFSYYF